MRTLAYSLRMLLFLAVFFAVPRGECQSTTPVAVFAVGAFKENEVVFPKRGFIGAPTSASAFRYFRPPEGADDFDTRFIRVTVLAVNKHAGAQRAILRIDEIDTQGAVLVDGLYYAYVDTLPQGIRVVCRHTDDGGDWDETSATGVRYGIPFPLTCARPPALGFKNGKKDGYVTSAGYGVEFARKDENAQPGEITVEATHFKADWIGEEPLYIAWYQGDIESITNDGRTKVLFREKQKWEKQTDWLWNEMERMDKDGNLLMRCRMK